jgi:lantibiotic transport system permease protein
VLHRYLIVEVLKLRRSLALLLCVAAPTCVALLNLLFALESERTPALMGYAMGISSLWSFAMLPLAITALSVLMAQMEHGPRSWLHLLTLPGARPHLYLAKALTMLVLIAGMSALLWVETLLTSWLIGALRTDVRDAVSPLWLGTTLARMAAASILVAMLQLWVALRFKSFVPPLIFGISGTFAGLVATSAKKGVFFPWLMAFNTLMPSERQSTALMLGSTVGLAAMVAMLAHLSWREA